VGYAATSTRLIADTAGLRQASIYHYFKAKQDILLALLLETVKPSLKTATDLLKLQAEPAAKLWALCLFDATLLSAGEENIGALYLLPEANDESMDEFRALRQTLQLSYQKLVSQIVGSSGKAAQSQSSMVMALVESVILIRREERILSQNETAKLIANSALRVLGLSDADIALAQEQAKLFI
jgi:AcrR family transcriptional regulator